MEQELQLRIAELIAIWETGCSNAHNGRPGECEECTVALIDAIKHQIEYETWKKFLPQCEEYWLDKPGYDGPTPHRHTLP